MEVVVWKQNNEMPAYHLDQQVSGKSLKHQRPKALSTAERHPDTVSPLAMDSSLWFVPWRWVAAMAAYLSPS
eukprot:g25155.t1